MTDPLIEHPECRTPLMVAAYRARAALRYPFLQAPWASLLAGPEGERFALEMDRFFPQFELWVALRTAYLDALVQKLTAEPYPFRQIVNLNAGTDTRPWRFAAPGRRFFETDPEPIHLLKQQRLAFATDRPTTDLTSLILDFREDDFISALQLRGFDCDAPALFLMEGTSYYMHDATFQRVMLEVVTRCHPQTLIAFDFAHKRVLERQRTATAMDQAVDYFARLRAPFRFAADDILPLLYGLSYRYVRTASFDEIALMFEGTWRREREFRFQFVALAGSVAPLIL